MGALLGVLSGLCGTGGAFLTVPYLVERSVDVKCAIATSSMVSALVAVTATLVNVQLAMQSAHVAGASGAAFGSSGAVCWPAALLIGASALACAPFGVACSHRLPVIVLRRAFALFTLAAVAATLASVVW
jgi:uncharacterized membrane protein YfcA